MVKLTLKSFLVILFTLLLFFLHVEKVEAQCDGVCDSAYDYYVCPQDCYVGSSCNTANCPGSQPANVCCRPGVACPEGKPTWTYAYNATCKVDFIDAANLVCSWHWQYQYCSAADRCSPCTNASGPEKVCAGICNDGGCTSGGWYKTCCQVQGAISSGSRLSGVNGTCSGGGCTGSNVATVRWGNFGSPGPTCSTNLCLQWYDGYSWVVSDCSAPTSAPGEPSPTPTTPPDDGGKSAIWLFLNKKEFCPTEPIIAQVCQKPDCCWDHHFFYDKIEVKIDNVGILCTASGFQSDPHCNSCATMDNKTNTGQDKNCTGTAPLPTGTYTVRAQYGGHSGQGGCNDEWKEAVEQFTVKSCPKTCSVSLNASQFTVGQTVTITARGIGNSNPGREAVRLWLEQWSTGSKGDAIVPTPEGTLFTHTSPDGRKFYNLGQCTSVNGSECQLSVNVSNLPQQSYMVHCDLPQVPYPPTCSGNPFCTYEGLGGWYDCPGYTSCSNMDNSLFTVSAPTPTPYMTVRFRSPQGAEVSHLVSRATWNCPTNTTGGYNQTETTATYIRDPQTNYACRGVRIGPMSSNEVYRGVTPSPSTNFNTWFQTAGARWFGWSNWYTGHKEMTIIIASPTPTNTPIPTSTPTPTCAPIPNPSLITCDVPNNRITWNAVTGASHYPLRVDDRSNPWSGVCSLMNPGDLCTDVYDTLRNFTFGVGKAYNVWVHSVSTCDGSWGEGPPASKTCYGPSPTPTPTPTCAPPANVDCNSPNNSSFSDKDVTLNWDPPLSSYWGNWCGSTTRLYDIFFEENEGYVSPDELLDTVSHPTLFYPITGLEDGTYWWGVKARNSLLSSVDFESICQFTIRYNRNPWWQTQDGDIHAQGSISSEISDLAANKYLSLKGANDPGVVSFGGSIYTSDEPISEKGWQANTTYGVINGYDYLYNKLEASSVAQVFTGDLPGASGVYYASSGKTLSGNWNVLSTSKVVIFVNGDVVVGTDVTVASGGFLAIISKGSITFGTSVTKAQGFFLADGTITISGPGSQQFVGQGSFVARGSGGIALQRTVGPVLSRTIPSEMFVSRPDFYVNALKEFLIGPSLFRELAP